MKASEQRAFQVGSYGFSKEICLSFQPAEFPDLLRMGGGANPKHGESGIASAVMAVRSTEGGS